MKALDHLSKLIRSGNWTGQSALLAHDFARCQDNLENEHVTKKSETIEIQKMYAKQTSTDY